MMTPLSRRRLIVDAGTVGLGLLAGCVRLPFPGQAQPPSRMYRLGFLAPDSSESRPQDTSFGQTLRDLGYSEGENLAIEYRYAEGHDERLPALADELAGLKVDVIVAVATPASLAAKNATSTIPIVFVPVGDPVASGLVSSLPRPGGNLTGLSMLSKGMYAKRLQLLKDVVPGASRMAVLVNAANPSNHLGLSEIQDAAAVIGIELRILEVRRPDDLVIALDAATLGRVDALNVLADPLLDAQVRRIVDLAAQYRLPTINPFREFAEAGGLMAYGPNLPDLYRRAAYYVDRILKGTKPADLPVEQPMTFDFVVNMKTAQALGITFPQEILLQITELVE